jgi:hypothetical protein
MLKGTFAAGLKQKSGCSDSTAIYAVVEQAAPDHPTRAHSFFRVAEN